jgi:hypothetical protein
MRSAVLWITVSLLVTVLPVRAEIFKCKTEGGTDLYQNFPCEIDSLGSLPSSANPKTGSVEPSPAAPAGKPFVDSGRNAAAKSVAKANEPSAGMTPDDVRAIWGEPEQVVQDEPPSGREEVWDYGNGRSVRFNAHRQRVSSVQH